MNRLHPCIAAAMIFLVSASPVDAEESARSAALAAQGWEVTRHLARGARIQDGDLQRVALGPRHRGASLSGSAQSLLGMRTRRPLAPGTVLREHYLERPPLVERGDAVTLRISRGSLQIEARGKATDSGNLGDSIRVVNVDSRKTVTGRVAADGTILVSF